MEKTKPVQVVMLPTEDKTIVKKFYMVDTYQLLFNQNHIIAPYQHIYFISTDLIKKHDYYLESRYEKEPFIDQADDSWEDDKTDSLFGKNPEGTFKVIASTDPSLGLPAIPTTWIRDEYVPSNGSIKEVRLKTSSFPYGIEATIVLNDNNEVVIVNEPNILEMTLKATTLSDDFVDQELEDAVKAEYLKMFPYPTSDDSKQILECLSKQSGFKQGAVFGADWKGKQIANDTMEFVDWILKTRYLPDLSGEVWLSDFGPDGHVKPFTTKELYDIWQQSKKK